MKQLIITTIAAVLLVGCAKNEITIANSGTNVWQKIEIIGGGQQFIIETDHRNVLAPLDTTIHLL